jgi:hypothetical protein
MRGSLFTMALAGALGSLGAGCGFDPTGASSGRDVEPDERPGADDPGGPGGQGPDGGAAEQRGVLESARVARPPILGAELDAAWAAAPRVGFSMAEAMRFHNMHPDYSFDGAVEFASLHDDDRLYFLFEVTDNLLRDDSTEPYQDDAVELYLDAAGDGSGPYGEDDHWIVIRSTGYYRSYGPAEIQISGAVQITDTGYRIEVSIERSQLGAPAGSQLGFNVGLVDDDGLGGDTLADAYGLWYAAEGPHCASCCPEADGPQAWCDTSLFGRLELEGP